MKILKRSIHPKNKDGFVTLQAEEDEDMYHLYNLILKGDIVEATTIRNVSCQLFKLPSMIYFKHSQ